MANSTLENEIKDFERDVDEIYSFNENRVISEIDIVPKIFINKWWGAIPFLNLNKDNWYAQETWGPRFFGQKEPWKGKQYKKLKLTANIYKKDYVPGDWYERDKNGHRIKTHPRTGKLIKHGEEEFENLSDEEKEKYRQRRDFQPGRYTIGKVGTRLPDKINYKMINAVVTKNREELVKKGLKGDALENVLDKIRIEADEIERVKTTFAKIPQIEHYYYDEEEDNYNREIMVVPNLEKIAEGIEAGKRDYHYYVLKNGEEWLNVFEDNKPRRELYGKLVSRIPVQFVKEFFGLSWPLKIPNPPKAIYNAVANITKTIWTIPRYFAKLGARRYEIITRVRETEEKQWFADKDPIKSLFWGNYYEVRTMSDSPPIVIIKRKRIKTFLYKLLSLGHSEAEYNIKILDKKTNKDKYFVRFLVDFAYQIEHDKAEHKLRFAESIGKDKEGKDIPNKYCPIYLKKIGIMGEFQPERLVARGYI